MKKICFIFRTGPADNAKGREALDLAMLSASFDQHVSLLFIDEGVLNLRNDQQPELLGGRDYISTFKALPLYDIEDIYLCNQSLGEYDLSKSDLVIDAKLAEPIRVSSLIKEADEVLVF
ncbi:MAG: sulfurtransferase complex subunit TusC [Parashewanella sp.]